MSGGPGVARLEGTDGRARVVRGPGVILMGRISREASVGVVREE